MAILKLKITKRFSKVFEINRELSIGRRKGNDIIILGDDISRYHARVYPKDSEIILEDLNSSNGLFVNGKKTSSKILENEDVINIGKKELIFSTQTSKKLDPKKLGQPPRANQNQIEVENIQKILQYVNPDQYPTLKELLDTVEKMQYIIRSVEQVMNDSLAGEEIPNISLENSQAAFEFLKNLNVKKTIKSTILRSVERSGEEIKYLKELGAKIEKTMEERLIQGEVITKEILWEIFNDCGMTKKSTMSELLMTGNLSDNFFHMLKENKEEDEIGQESLTDVLSFFDAIDEEVVKENTAQIEGAIVGEISEIERNFIGNEQLKENTKAYAEGQFDLLTQIALYLFSNTDIPENSVNALMRLSAYHFEESYIKESLEVIGNAFCCPDYFEGYNELQSDLQEIDSDIENAKAEKCINEGEKENGIKMVYDIHDLRKKVQNQLMSLFEKYPHLEEYVPHPD